MITIRQKPRIEIRQSPVIAAHGSGEVLRAQNLAGWSALAGLIVLHGDDLTRQRYPGVYEAVIADIPTPPTFLPFTPLGAVVHSQSRLNRSGLRGSAWAYIPAAEIRAMQQPDPRYGRMMASGVLGVTVPDARQKALSLTYDFYESGHVIADGALYGRPMDFAQITPHQRAWVHRLWSAAGLGDFVECPDVETTIADEPAAVRQMDALVRLAIGEINP